MIEITTTDNKVKTFEKATNYTLADEGWYVLTDDKGKGRGRIQAGKVLSIRQVDEEELRRQPDTGPKFSFPPPSKLPW